MNKLSWLLCGAGLLLIGALLLTGCKVHENESKDSDDIDGGVVVRKSGDDAPKVIESTEITEFRCVTSLLTVLDSMELGKRVYTMEAVRQGETVSCRYEWYGEGGSDQRTFETDVSFLDSLHDFPPIIRRLIRAYTPFYHYNSSNPRSQMLRRKGT